MSKGPLPLSRNGYLPGKPMDPRKRARILTPFARWLKATRIRSTHQGKPITQEMLAELLDMSFSTISKLENGQMHPQLDDLPKFAQFFRVDVADLYLRTYNLPPDMHLFLCTTVEGEKVIRNIRTIMQKIDANGGPHLKPDVPTDAKVWTRGNIYVHERVNHFSALDVERFAASLDEDDEEELASPVPLRDRSGRARRLDPDHQSQPGADERHQQGT